MHLSSTRDPVIHLRKQVIGDKFSSTTRCFLLFLDLYVSLEKKKHNFCCNWHCSLFCCCEKHLLNENSTKHSEELFFSWARRESLSLCPHSLSTELFWLKRRQEVHIQSSFVSRFCSFQSRCLIWHFAKASLQKQVCKNMKLHNIIDFS